MFKKTKSSLAVTLSVAMLATMVTIPGVASAATATQLSGKDRYETALKIVEAGWTKSDSAVIARGDDLADALAAAPLAYAKGKAPILLTKTNEISAAVLAELKSLGVKNVYIVGGVGAVSKEVADKLAMEGLTVTRVSGNDRFETSLKIAKEAFATAPADVVIANGLAYADALSVSSIAASKGMPILLVSGNGLSAEQTSYIAGKTVYAVGGEGVLSTGIVTATKATRLAGLDRYKTNAAVLAKFAPNYSKIYLAKGTPANLVDSLAGSALAALGNNPIVLVDGNSMINADQAAVVKANIKSDSALVTLGGTVTSVATDAVEALKVVDAALAVSSVSAINARAIKITFTQPVDPTTVLDDNDNLLAGVVSIGAAGSALTDLQTNAGYTGVFNATNTELTVYNKVAASAWTKDTMYNVTVNSVKTLAAIAVPAYATVVKMSESVVPAFSTVTAITNLDKTRTVTVQFTEPVNFSAVTVNGKVVGAAPTNANYPSKWTLTTSEDLLAGSSYAVVFNGLTDLLGNTVSNASSMVSVVKDITLPVPTITATGEKTFKVEFNKDMSSSVDITSVKTTKKDSAGNTVVVPIGALPSYDASGLRKFSVTLAATPFNTATETSKEVTVTVTGLKDSLGNVMADYTQTVTLSKDIVKPAITSVSQTPGFYNKLNVTLSEVATSVTSGANLMDIFKVTDMNGNAVRNAADSGYITVSGTATGYSLGLNADNMTTLTLSEALPSTASYKLVLVQSLIKDGAAVANTNAAQVVSFNYNKSAAAAAAQLVATPVALTTPTGLATDSASNKIITVNFNQTDVVNGVDTSTGTWKVGSADNLLNYTIDGNQLPTGTTITFGDNSGVGGKDFVTINFVGVSAANMPTEFAKGGTATIAVSNVKTVAGSTVGYTALNLTVADATAPKVSESYMTGNATAGYTLTVIMTEKMSKAAAADFVLTADKSGTPVVVTLDTEATTTSAIGSSDATKLTFTIAAGADATKIETALNTGKILTLTTNATANTLDQATTPNQVATDATGVVVVKY